MSPPPKQDNESSRSAEDQSQDPGHPNTRLVPKIVTDKEQAYIDRRRKAALGDQGDKEVPLVGIAMSGGGIRSATFCLGVLQSLAGNRLLKFCDYLCTVSGGGYIGSCLTSLLTVTKRDENPNSRLRHKQFYEKQKSYNVEDEMPLSGKDPDQMHHLRSHGDFLILRNGAFRRDFLRSLGTIVLSVVCSLLLYAATLTVLVSLYIAVVALLGNLLTNQETIWKNLLENSASYKQTFFVTYFVDALGMMGRINNPGTWLVLCSGGVGSIAVTRLIWSRTTDDKQVPSGLNPEDRAERSKLLLQIGIVIIVLIGCLLMLSKIPKLKPEIPKGEDFLFFELWYPLMFFGSDLIAAVVISIFDASNKEQWDRENRSIAGSMIAICVYGLVFSLLIPMAAFGIALIGNNETYTIEWTSFWSVISMLAARILSMQAFSARPNDSSTLQTVKTKFVPIAVNLAVVIFIFATAILLAAFIIGNPELNLIRLSWIFFGGIVALILLGRFVDFNRISPHDFYRDRLTEAYLRTEVRKRGGLSIGRDDSNLLVRQLHDRFVLDDNSESENPCPYHLIQCAINLAGSRDLARKDRKSDHFIFSREYCGSSTTGYIATSEYDEGTTTLASAMTVSGAAASSAMGFYTSFAQAFLTTLFNIRLGVWMVNPRAYENDVVYPRARAKW